MSAESVLQSISAALHLNAAPVTGQSSSRAMMQRNPLVNLDTSQPHIAHLLVSEDDIQRQEQRVLDARRRLQDALREEIGLLVTVVDNLQLVTVVDNLQLVTAVDNLQLVTVVDNLQLVTVVDNLQLVTAVDNLQLVTAVDNLQLVTAMDNLQLVTAVDNLQLVTAVDNLQLVTVVDNLQLVTVVHNLQLVTAVDNLQLVTAVDNLQLVTAVDNLQLVTVVDNLQLVTVVDNLQLVTVVDNLQLVTVVDNLQLVTVVDNLVGSWPLLHGSVFAVVWSLQWTIYNMMMSEQVCYDLQHDDVTAAVPSPQQAHRLKATPQCGVGSAQPSTGSQAKGNTSVWCWQCPALNWPTGYRQHLSVVLAVPSSQLAHRLKATPQCGVGSAQPSTGSQAKGNTSVWCWQCPALNWPTGYRQHLSVVLAVPSSQLAHRLQATPQCGVGSAQLSTGPQAKGNTSVCPQQATGNTSILVLAVPSPQQVKGNTSVWCWQCPALNRLQATPQCGVGSAQPSTGYRQHLSVVLAVPSPQQATGNTSVWCWQCPALNRLQATPQCGVGSAQPSTGYRQHLSVVLAVPSPQQATGNTSVWCWQCPALNRLQATPQCGVGSAQPSTGPQATGNTSVWCLQCPAINWPTG
ncbi:hypothetical protein ACOMHN_012158 [Nucella lapillus]